MMESITGKLSIGAEVRTKCVSARIVFKAWMEDKGNTIHHKESV